MLAGFWELALCLLLVLLHFAWAIRGWQGMKKPIFDGCVFSTAGNLSRSNLDISKAIKDNGGVVSYLITKKTTHLLTTQAEVQTKSTKIRSAVAYGAHVVREDFLWDAISAQSLPAIAAYTIPVDGLEVSVSHHDEKRVPLSIAPAISTTPSPSIYSLLPTPKPLVVSTFTAKPVSEAPKSFSIASKPATSDLNPQVKDLVEYIYAEATSAFVTNFDAKITPKGIETPLGVLSSFQIDKGERVLKEINQILKTSEEEVCSNPKLELLSSQFYTTIPHSLGKTAQEAQARVIRTLPHLQAKQEHLQLMRDMLSASSTGALTKSEIDIKYKALKCDIQPLTKGTQEYNQVLSQLDGNRENFEVLSVYKIKRANEHERFNRSMSTQKTLLHGTHIANVVGVLSRGILPPKTLVGVGGKRTDFGWLGSGIYFSSNVENSAKFTTAGSRGTRFLLAATVALGTVKEYSQITPSLERPPMGFHSAHGKPGPGSDFTADEYAVYKPEQQKLEYLIEFKLRSDAIPPSVARSPKKSPVKPRATTTSSSSSIYSSIPTSSSSSYASTSSYASPFSFPSSTPVATPPQFSADLTSADAAIKSKEDNYRNLFVQSRNHSDLRNPHLMLVDISNTSKFMYNNNKVEYPMILQSQRESKARNGCAVVSPSQFTENFNKFTENQFNGMNWDNVFVAGGCVLASMLQPDAQGNGYKSSDVDMFFYGLNENQANQKLKYIYELVKENTKSPCEVIRTKHAVTIVNQFPYRHIQIVLRLYKSPAEVLMGFDIDSCAVGYDGKNAYALERACRAITRGFNLVDMSRRSLTYESRLYKYSKRGFAVAIPGFNRNKVNPEIFTKSLKDVKGLAQLLLFEFNAFKNSTTKNPFKSNKVPTSQIKHPDSFTEDRLQEFETLRANKELPDSDYSSVYIPWGPQWFAKQILNLLNYQDKAQFFAKKNSIKHKHIFVSGIEGVLEGKSFWCRKCKEHEGSTPVDQSGEDYVSGPLKWLQDNPGRQLLTGSFHPVSDDEWETQAYRGADDTQFSLLNGIFSNDPAQVARNATTPPPSTSSGVHPLLFASLLGNSGAVETLLKVISSPSSIKDSNNFNAAHYAAVGGKVEVLKALLKSDKSFINQTKGGKQIAGITPLHLALYYGNTSVAEYLRDQFPSSLSERDDKNRGPLHFASLGGSVECCKLFLKANLQDANLLNDLDNDGLTPITAAKRNGHQELLRYFLTITPSNIDTTTNYSELITSPPQVPHLAVLTSVASGSQVAQSTDKINESDAFGLRPIHIAATLPFSNYSGVLNSVLHNGRLEAECVDVIGQTPAHYAVLYGNFDALNSLQNYIDLNKPNMLGQTPAHYAAMLLGTLSGFRNSDVAGLPEPRLRSNLVKIADYLKAQSSNLALSPYPLPPLLPSEFLSYPSPFAQQQKAIPTVAPAPVQKFGAPSFGFSSSAPKGVAGKFPSVFGSSTFGSVAAAKPKKASKSRFDEDYSEEEEEEDEDEEKPKSTAGRGKSSVFGSFGKPAATSSGFGTSTFGSFGKPATTSSGFGQPATASGFGTSTFGSFGKPATSSGFGQPATTSSGFGQPATAPSGLFGSFGKPATSSGFGQPATSGFGQPATTSSGFGQPATTPSGLFGSFGKPAATTSGFGQPATSGFGQPAKSLFGSSPVKAASGFNLGTQPIQQSNESLFGRPATPQPPSTSVFDQSDSGSQDPPSMLARVLVLISLLSKGHNITLDEKGLLKNAALEGNPLLAAAVECYEIDQDLDEFSDTASRVIAMLRR